MSKTAPRLMSLKQAAEYCGYSCNRFRELANQGVFPKPLENTRRWDKKKIDSRIDELSDLSLNDDDLSPAGKWKLENQTRT